MPPVRETLSYMWHVPHSVKQFLDDEKRIIELLLLTYRTEPDSGVLLDIRVLGVDADTGRVVPRFDLDQLGGRSFEQSAIA